MSANKTKVAKFFKLSADQSYPAAQYEYGRSLTYTRASVRPEAARYLKLSADSGNQSGQYMYGYCCLHGFGVPRSEAGYNTI
jgi:TPR repeat protein